jgi:tetratricopeptide (TPR) repeat protein
MPAGVVLSILSKAGNPERLVAEAYRCLGRDPDDLDAHFYLVMGLCDLRQLKEAEEHVHHLLRLDPESLDTHVAAIRFYLVKKQWKKALRFIETGLQIAPDYAYFYYAAAIVECGLYRPAEARKRIARARELEPEEPEIMNLYIQLHAGVRTSAKDSWDRLREYEKALALEPGNSSLHNSIGDLYLDELENPAKAEEHYRMALRGEPGNRDYQRDLFHAVARRSTLYCLFALPSRTFESIRRGLTVLRDHWWIAIFLVVAYQFVGAFLAWLAVATVLLWPGCKVYEWFIVSELRGGSSTSIPMLSLWLRIRRFPLWLRFGAFLALNGLLWALLFLLAGVSLRNGFGFVGIFVGVHYAVLLGMRMVRKFEAWEAGRGTRGHSPS